MLNRTWPLTRRDQLASSHSTITVHDCSIESRASLVDVGFGHDVVAAVNAFGAVTDHLHRHLSRNPSALEVANRRTPQVVRDAVRHLRGFAAGSPCLVKGASVDRLAVLVKDEKTVSHALTLPAREDRS